jgi:hypothetical protein
MAHWLEFDFRYSWTLETLVALDRGIEKCSAGHSEGLDRLEHAEELVVLAFVALQGYVSGTQANLRTVFPTLAVSNEGLRARNCPVTAGVSHIEAIWAVGNYYKHHEEWPDWAPSRARKSTVLTLDKLEVSAVTEFRCMETVKALHGGWVPLTQLLRGASEWREAWFSELRMGMLPNPTLQR